MSTATYTNIVIIFNTTTCIIILIVITTTFSAIIICISAIYQNKVKLTHLQNECREKAMSLIHIQIF